MKKNTRAMILMAGVILLLVMPGVLYADIFIKQRQHRDAITIMGQTAEAVDETATIWMAEGMFRNDHGTESDIVRMDRECMYIIDHQTKTYREIPMDISKAINEGLAADGASPEESQQIMQFARQAAKVTVTVEPTSEKKKINKFNCRKYIQKMQTMMGVITTEVWATQDIKMDYNLYAQGYASFMSMQPGMDKAAAKITRELEKIKGVVVRSETMTNMMGMAVRSSQELLECKKKKAPRGCFEVPSGYTKKEI